VIKISLYKYTDHFWYEKWFGEHVVFYYGNGQTYRFGLVLGQENTFYFLNYCIGIDFVW